MFKKEIMLMSSKSRGGVITYEISQELVNRNCSCFVYLNDEALDLDATSGSFGYSIDDEILFGLWFFPVSAVLEESMIEKQVTGGSIVCIDDDSISVLATPDKEVTDPILTGISYMYQFFPTGGNCTVKFS